MSARKLANYQDFNKLLRLNFKQLIAVHLLNDEAFRIACCKNVIHSFVATKKVDCVACQSAIGENFYKNERRTDWK
jgi:hypothetical protein